MKCFTHASLVLANAAKLHNLMQTMLDKSPANPNLYALTTQAKEQIFVTELLKNGIEPQKAAKAAKIMASKKLDEPMAAEEARLVEMVCREWLKQRKRRDFIDEVIQTSVFKKNKR